MNYTAGQTLQETRNPLLVARTESGMEVEAFGPADYTSAELSEWPQSAAAEPW